MMSLPIIVFLVKATALLLVALLASVALSRASAGSRHLVWLLALIGLLLLPALAFWGPLPIPLLPPGSLPGSVAPDPAVIRETHRPVVVVSRGPEKVPATAIAPAERTQALWAAAADHESAVLLIAWALGALGLGLRLAWGVQAVRGIVRRGRRLDEPDWQTPLYEIADRLDLEVVPRLLRSDEVHMPFAAGLVHPTIVLPAESHWWSPERRSAVLIHELSHIRRHDLVGHTIGRIACALYWFHPLVWTAARRLRGESERACDDLALVFGTPPSEYAEHLLDIVTGVRDASTPAVALALAHRKEFEGRMLAILDPGLHRRSPGRLQTASIATGLGLTAILVGAAAPVPRTTAATVSLQLPAGVVVQDTVQGAPRTVPLPSGLTAHTPRPTPMPGPVKHAENHASDDRAAVLARTLRADANASVRRIAAWGLSEYADEPVAVEGLAAAAGSDADASVREMAAWALAEAKPGSVATGALVRAVRQDKDPKVRETAVWALGSIGDESAVETLAGVLADADPKMRELAAWAIGSCEPKHAPSGLVSALADRVRDVREAVAWALFTIEDPSAAGAIDAALRRETDSEVQLGLIKALGAMGENSVDALERLVASPDSEVRNVAIRALAGGDASEPWPWPRPEPRPSP